MRFAVMHAGLQPRETDTLAIVRQRNPHFLTNAFEHLRHFSNLGCIGIPNREHGIFMALFRANRRRPAIRPGSNHFQRQIGVMTMHANENTRFYFIAPNREIGMIGVDHFLRLDLRIFGTIIGHRDNEHFRDLGREFQDGFGLLGRVVIPIP